MSQFAPVAWKEGMFMVPQHFQQADRANAHQWDTRFKGIAPYGWGIQTLGFQEGAVRQGRIELTNCRAVLPDGLVIDIPTADSAPAARPFSLGTDNKPLDVYLALPAPQARLPTLTRDKDRSDVRFVEREVKIADDYLPDRQQTIRVATKNLQILLGDEPTGGKVIFRLGRLVAGPDGTPQLSPRHPPALVFLSASAWLEQEVRGLVAKADARAQSMATERSRVTGAAVEFSQGDILAFWFLHSLNTSLLVLKQLLRQKDIHPYQIFLELLRLAGSLASFESSELSSLQWYDHENPGPAFEAVLKVLRRQLDYMVTLKHEIIPMTRGEDWWQGELLDVELRQSGTYLLAVIGEKPTQEGVTALMKSMKIADPDSLETLVARSLPGIPFQFVTQVPSTVPTRPDACYFVLDQRGPIWQRVQQGGVLAVYLPAYLGKLRPELVGIRGSKK